MSGATFAAVAVIVLFALAGGYVWGWLNGSARAQHAPQKCREMLEAAKRAGAIWQRRAAQLERENNGLRHDLAEIERGVTASTKILLEEIDKAIAAAAPEPLALPAPAPAGSAA